MIALLSLKLSTGPLPSALTRLEAATPGTSAAVLPSTATAMSGATAKAALPAAPPISSWAVKATVMS